MCASWPSGNEMLRRDTANRPCLALSEPTGGANAPWSVCDIVHSTEAVSAPYPSTSCLRAGCSRNFPTGDWPVFRLTPGRPQQGRHVPWSSSSALGELSSNLPGHQPPSSRCANEGRLTSINFVSRAKSRSGEKSA